MKTNTQTPKRPVSHAAVCDCRLRAPKRLRLKTPDPRPETQTARNSPALLTVFERVAQQRLRQRQLLRDGKILFNCDSPIASDDRKLRVLAEELGEVARAVDWLERCSRPERVFAREDLHDELTQLAAVAAAWLETFEP